MNQQQGSAVSPAADQLMRLMLNAAERLRATYAADTAEVTRLRQEGQRKVSEAEKATRSQAGREVAAVSGLSDATSLGRKLRAELAKIRDVSVKHVDAGSPPTTLAEAISEWKTLAPMTQRDVNDLKAAFGAWSQKMIKRAKAMPTVSDDLWRRLDRLDLIHRSVQPLSHALVADVIRHASGDSDVVIQAETERRSADHKQQADKVQKAVAAVQAAVGLAGVSWADDRWDSPAPAETVEHLIRLGELQAGLPAELGVVSVPALTAFPFTAGLAIGSDVSSRASAIGLMRSIILRLFAAVPPGGLHVKAVDPVALGQSVAEFRHLSEYDSQLMDEKTWTAERDIERLLEDLSDHLEVVISRYLRGQFETIDEYNEHAGEVAQPYRLLTVFDYPAGFSDRATKQLLSLIENGPRCGVYTVLHYDKSALDDEGRRDPAVERLIHSMEKVMFEGQRVGQVGPSEPDRSHSATLELTEPVGSIASRFIPDEAPPLTFDADGQPETSFAKLLPRVGTYVKRSLERPPAVTLGSLLPVLSRSRGGVLPDFEPGAPTFGTSPESWWHASTAEEAVAPIGRSGAQGVTSMFFSSTEVAGGAIMVGLPRSGKTTSLHSMILGLSMLYSPEELELYLIDAKHGVEFKVYETLPQARMISVHSEREFSLAVLQSIEKEIQRRAEMMKSHGAGLANITEYRMATSEKLPRIVVVIDEFHELFEEADETGLAAFSSFSNIVRMGPFSGAHIVVASQTLSSMPAMDRPTLTLLPQRVAFMCNEYDAEIVMGEANKATRLLSKTGEGLFNPSRGEESKNQPFQGLYIPADERTVILRELRGLAAQRGWARVPRVFDGDALVPRPPTSALVQPGPRFSVPLGEPFSLATRESLTFARTRGANLLVLGDKDEEDSTDLAARGALHSVLLAARSHGAAVTVVDFVVDEALSDRVSVMDLAEIVGARYVRSRGLPGVLEELGALVAERTESEDYRAPTNVLVLFGLQRALTLTPYDHWASYDEPPLSQYLAAVLANGPEVGVHTVIDADRARSIETRLGTDILNELTLRIAGSGADQKDLGAVAGSFGIVPTLRYGQLLLGDQMKGTSKRIRGYRPVSGQPTTGSEE